MYKTLTQTEQLTETNNEAMRWQLPDETEQEYLDRMERKSDRDAWYDMDL